MNKIVHCIGDVQGCFATLSRLLARIAFDAKQHELWFVGDLVNRGPRSLDVLRFAYANRESVRIVLGNHDLHLLSRAVGVRGEKKGDTLDDVLAAPDRDLLVDWLAHQPLFYRDGAYAMLHAGLLPSWTIEEAEKRARDAELLIADPSSRADFLASRGKKNGDWQKNDDKRDRPKNTVAVMTRVRMVRSDGTPDFEYAGPPKGAPKGLVPWFDAKDRRARNTTLVVGHWAALGLYLAPDVIALDSGCVWGDTLSAVRLRDRTIFSEPCADR